MIQTKTSKNDSCGSKVRESDWYFVDYFSITEVRWYRCPLETAADATALIAEVLASGVAKSIRISREDYLSEYDQDAGTTRRAALFGPLYQQAHELMISDLEAQRPLEVLCNRY